MSPSLPRLRSLSDGHPRIQFCFRICTNANSTYSTEYMCWHELDEMGCEFVMPGNYDINGTFETCEADVAYPPGWYPTATSDGTTLFSTFAQYYEGVYTCAYCRGLALLT